MRLDKKLTEEQIKLRGLTSQSHMFAFIPMQKVCVKYVRITLQRLNRLNEGQGEKEASPCYELEEEGKLHLGPSFMMSNHGIVRVNVMDSLALLA